MGTPQIGDPRSPFSWENGDPGPHFHNILETLGPGSPLGTGYQFVSPEDCDPIFRLNLIPPNGDTHIPPSGVHLKCRGRKSSEHLNKSSD